MGKVYYNQADSRWANHPYPAYPGYETMTCKTSGCGATCGAMIVSSCRETIYPDAMCDIARENGHRVPGGTADSFFPYVSQRWGIEMKRVYSSYEAHQACKDGYFVVICCRNGLWTTSGHFILAVGATDTEIEIYDPYLYNGKFNKNGRQGIVRMEGMSAWVNIDEFKAHSNAQRFFAFNVGIENTKPVEQPKEENVETKIAWVNTNKSNLNVRNAPNGAVIGSLAKGTQVMVYELRDGWARIGNEKWVSNSYLRYESAAPVAPSIPNTVGQMRKFKAFTYLWSNPDLTGTRYDYKAKTQVKILENVSASVDKIFVPATNRTAYVSTSAYEGGTSQPAPVSKPASTVGQTKVLKTNTTLWSKPDLSGTRYNYLAGTKVKILENTSSSVDKIVAIKTNRVAYVSNKAYK